MKKTTLTIAAFLGMLSIILGAFGAHAFKEILTPEKLQSFETGVRYQSYASFYLLIIGWIFSFENNKEKWISRFMIIGIVLFSFSIYFLSFQEVWNVSLKFLGPITPLGGLFMIISWFLLFLNFLRK